MIFNVISNIDNKAGLERDFKLLKCMLERYGHTVYGHNFLDLTLPRIADVNIYVEVLAPHTLDRARDNWLIPNSEWWFSDRWDRYLHMFSRILCKTMDCLRIWSNKVGADRCKFIGWEAEDFYRPEIKKQLAFLHLAGRSETKNTEAVVQAWRRHNIQYPLIVSAFKPNIADLCYNVPNLVLIPRFDDEGLIQVLNQSQFFLMPSVYEGYGHALREAAACGAVVLTTNAPPMNEIMGIPRDLLIPVSACKPLRGAVSNTVSHVAVAQAVEMAASLSAGRLDELATEAREGFLMEREEFRQRFAKVMNA